MEKEKRLRVAAVQLASNDDKERNIANADKLVKEAIAAKAEFIVFPETFNYRGDSKNLSLVSEEIPGKSLLPLIELSKRHKVWILAGTIFEKVNYSVKQYNTSVLIDNFGNITAKYRKIHLFDAIVDDVPVRESERYVAGDKPVLTDVRGFKVGMSICFDLRFPELYRRYSSMGADVLVIPSSFTKVTGAAHWEVLLRARAIENLCYVLAPNQVGVDGDGVQSYGNSMIISPWGEIIAQASDADEEIIFADLKEEEVKSARKRLPLMGPEC